MLIAIGLGSSSAGNSFVGVGSEFKETLSALGGSGCRKPESLQPQDPKALIYEGLGFRV